MKKRENLKKRKNLGGVWGECWEILGGAVQTPTNFRGGIFGKMSWGEILGGSTKGACDAVGMVRNEKKGKI